MISKIKSVAAAILAGVLVSVAVGQAPALAAKSDCSAYEGTVCLFAANNWGGPVWRLYPEQINGCVSLVPYGFNDVTTMVYNNTNGSVDFVTYQNADCTGDSFGTGPNRYRDLSGNWWNDKISAVRVILL